MSSAIRAISPPPWPATRPASPSPSASRKADPDNAGWQRDLSVSHNKIGDVERAQGDLAAALASYKAALAIAERLAKADPNNAGWQRDLALSYGNVAMIEARQGRAEAARAGFSKGAGHPRATAADFAGQCDAAEGSGVARGGDRGAAGGAVSHARCDTFSVAPEAPRARPGPNSSQRFVP